VSRLTRLPLVDNLRGFGHHRVIPLTLSRRVVSLQGFGRAPVCQPIRSSFRRRRPACRRGFGRHRVNRRIRLRPAASLREPRRVQGFRRRRSISHRALLCRHRESTFPFSRRSCRCLVARVVAVARAASLRLRAGHLQATSRRRRSRAATCCSGTPTMAGFWFSQVVGVGAGAASLRSPRIRSNFPRKSEASTGGTGPIPSSPAESGGLIG
jgi:hypothetical protein